MLEVYQVAWVALITQERMQKNTIYMEMGNNENATSVGVNPGQLCGVRAIISSFGVVVEQGLFFPFLEPAPFSLDLP